MGVTARARCDCTASAEMWRPRRGRTLPKIHRRWPGVACMAEEPSGQRPVL